MSVVKKLFVDYSSTMALTKELLIENCVFNKDIILKIKGNGKRIIEISYNLETAKEIVDELNKQIKQLEGGE